MLLEKLNLFKKRKELRISTNITAMDGKVIARTGDRIDDDFLSELPLLPKEDLQCEEAIGESHHYYNLKMFLRDPKYACIEDLDRKKDHVFKIIAAISLNGLVMKELNWLERYGYHYDHTLAVAALVTSMALDFYDDEAEVEHAAACALTHDIGMMRVPEEIFLKVSTLSDSERSILQEHPIYGYVLLNYYGYAHPKPNAQVALDHHEDLYGNGYPRGIKSNQTVAHMVKLADMFDSLITTRPYRPAKSPAEAMDIIRAQQTKRPISSEVYSLLERRVNVCKRPVVD